MNYEDLYQALSPDQKTLKDSIASLQKLQKTISRETESGDLKNLSKDLASLSQTAAALSAAIENLSSSVNNFDAKAYFESGDFASQMLDICKENELDVQGEFPVYEMFPYRVRLDVENQDIYLDKNGSSVCAPQAL